ncbi:hypothetical protein [Sediminibacterium sp.]|nr:hypothetical protein [Sediminibacterium sp.]MDP1972374.1 hypothetical protein [Sediminibacterium sp.]MDP2421482.1 hypothetical protein [Sediminibacterium sp.]
MSLMSLNIIPENYQRLALADDAPMLRRLVKHWGMAGSTGF